MKVTQEMIGAAMAGADIVQVDMFGMEKRLQAALADVPDVEPFTFGSAQAPPLAVYIHQCGTVIDVSPADPATAEQVAAGECDCETTSPWRRVYVEREA